MRVAGHLDRWPGRLGPPLAAALAFLLFLGAIGVGLRVAPFGLLFPFGRAPALDYSASPLRGISPLEPNFIKNVLGDYLAEDPQAVEAPTGGARHNVRLPVPAGPISETHPLTNDDVAAARRIPSVPYQAKTNTTKASSEPREPSDCGSLGGTVWYRYNPREDVALVANTFGSNYPTTLGVFDGEPGDLTNIGCDTDVRGNAIVPFAATKNTTYFFQIGGPRGGELVFNLEQQGTITLESVSVSGKRGDQPSSEPALSADGRYLAFSSPATNLVVGSDNRACMVRDPGPGLPYLLTTALLTGSPCEQIIVRDRFTGAMSLATLSSSDVAANGHSFHPAVSADGRYVAFSSHATNLVTDDTNESVDVFVRDLVSRQTERVSVSSTGKQLEDIDGENGAETPSISSDGRYVAFETAASNLVADDKNRGPDVFVHDRVTRTTERVSVSSSGKEAEPIGSTVDYLQPKSWLDAHRASPCISPDGRLVAFRSSAINLVPGDENARADTFVRDIIARRTIRVSVSSDGREGDGDSGPFARRSRPCISAGGRYVTFSSEASNLVAGDSNGVIDVFVHDISLRRTIRVSVSSSEAEADRGASNPTISADGKYVAFQSGSSRLAPGDNNELVDVFVHDLHTRTTIRVSVTPAGDTTDGDAGNPSLSSDGSIVGFDSLMQTERYLLLRPGSNVFVYEGPRQVADPGAPTQRDG